MHWENIRQTHPNKWLAIEAIEAETTPPHKRVLNQIAVIERCADAGDAVRVYRRFHQQYPYREFYFVHTSRETLDIREQRWVGIRSDNLAELKLNFA